MATLRRSAQLLDDPAWAGLAVRLTDPVLNVGERWAEAALTDLSALGTNWHEFVAQAVAGAHSARPTAKWERGVGALLTNIGATAARTRVQSWLSLVGTPRTRSLIESGPRRWGLVNERLDPFNVHVLRGLVLTLPLMEPDEGTVSMLGSLVDTCTHPVGEHGPRDLRVANAAVNALSRMGDAAALEELRLLAVRTSHGITRSLIVRRIAGR
ncbi:hypothetical protein ACIQB5_51775 [Streptomyces sp. NPDC088560]|uniref:hypothetical protein n=1 Tax=Streptomyces sp. NPDC088560 TaxID=3365868 RepID=UPI0037FE940A